MPLHNRKQKGKEKEEKKKKKKKKHEDVYSSAHSIFSILPDELFSRLPPALFSTLPPELIVIIFQHLVASAPEAFPILPMVCKRWQALARDKAVVRAWVNTPKPFLYEKHITKEINDFFEKLRRGYNQKKFYGFILSFPQRDILADLLRSNWLNAAEKFAEIFYLLQEEDLLTQITGLKAVLAPSTLNSKQTFKQNIIKALNTLSLIINFADTNFKNNIIKIFISRLTELNLIKPDAQCNSQVSSNNLLSSYRAKVRKERINKSIRKTGEYGLITFFIGLPFILLPEVFPIDKDYKQLLSSLILSILLIDLFLALGALWYTEDLDRKKWTTDHYQFFKETSASHDSNNDEKNGKKSSVSPRKNK